MAFSYYWFHTLFNDTLSKTKVYLTFRYLKKDIYVDKEWKISLIFYTWLDNPIWTEKVVTDIRK